MVEYSPYKTEFVSSLVFWAINNRIISDTIYYVISLKLCMLVLLIERYVVIPLSLTLTIFQGRSSIKQFELKILSSYLSKFIKKIKNIGTAIYFFASAHIQRKNWCASWFDNNFIIGFVVDTVYGRSFKLCMILT